MCRHTLDKHSCLFSPHPPLSPAIKLKTRLLLRWDSHCKLVCALVCVCVLFSLVLFVPSHFLCLHKCASLSGGVTSVVSLSAKPGKMCQMSWKIRLTFLQMRVFHVTVTVDFCILPSIQHDSSVCSRLCFNSSWSIVGGFFSPRLFALDFIQTLLHPAADC